MNGRNSEKSKKTWPTVRLNNFIGQAILICYLCQIGNELAHPHSLVVRHGSKIEKIVSKSNNYEAEFKKMCIINTKRRKAQDKLFKKLVEQSEFRNGHRLNRKDRIGLREEAKKCLKDMDFKQVRLCFEAYHWIDKKRVRLCDPVYSEPINDASKFKLYNLSTFSYIHSSIKLLLCHMVGMLSTLLFSFYS